MGFEPTNGGFADLSLGPLGYRAKHASITLSRPPSTYPVRTANAFPFQLHNPSTDANTVLPRISREPSTSFPPEPQSSLPAKIVPTLPAASD